MDGGDQEQGAFWANKPNPTLGEFLDLVIEQMEDHDLIGRPIVPFR